MAFVPWLPLLVALHSVPAAPAKPAPAPVSFASWFDARVKEEAPNITERYQVDLDGDGREDEVVCFPMASVDRPKTWDGPPVTLVGLASGERFAMSGGAGVDEPLGCPSPTSTASGSGLPTLLLQRAGAGTSSSVTLRFDRKGPMLVASNVNPRFSLRRMDLLAQSAATFHYTPPDPEDPDSEGNESKWEGSARVVSDLESTVLPSPGQVTWGQKNWKGPEDADLTVSLRRRGDLMVVSVRLRDDKTVVAADASPKAILAADHLELRWMEWGTTRFMRDQQVELGVARNKQGAPVATWFKPPKKKDTPPPTIRWTSPEAVEVEVPLAWFMPTPAKLDYYDPTRATAQFTVFFSDGDGRGQETLVNADPGMLFVADPGRPFPSLAQVVQPWVRVEDGATLRSLLW
ncbi:hypothetical protein [Myxococcus llanfairpwllgwyngyllgogerychwyrndrobwllllantysiliogogogochensis]|uniref:hypothetical protein n=1 Tax=Myxococcus llanfairpwllgwyngyllgogerychwyrndrobwllllantysiliogogogochensis TaxID=2590453 RepID=UPI0015F0932E|nr:hypothetical protein [Myxococcus llanfairpwllgwyngyllgogerychwyrndrobwllllantysiliogogogochensis]